MSNIIGYKNQLWKVIHDFKYTGTDQPFTLSPGSYLFICKGASGGMHVRFENTCIRELGGIAYGVIDINTTKTFHAIVGGNGGDVGAVDPAIENPGIGGFNGGAPGGQPTERYLNGTYYAYGAGGGGATDIRLLPYDPDEYPTYDEDGTFHEPEHPCEMLYDATYDATTDDPAHKFYQLEYVQTNGNFGVYGELNLTTSFKTDYIPKRNTKVRYEGMVNSYGFTGNNFFALFGARYAYMQNEYTFLLRSNGVNNPTYARNNRYESVSGDAFPFDQHVVIECYRDKAEWFVNGESKGSIIIPGYYDEDGTGKFTINGTHNSNGNTIQDSSMKQHFFRFTISEIENDEETIVRDYVPAERVSDGNIGIFDTVNRTFLPHYTRGTLIKTPYKRQHPSIDSRIMVAGGGGGTINNGSIDMMHGVSGGGGVNGGLMFTAANFHYEPNFRFPINQSTGYTQGYAIPGTKRVSWNIDSVDGTGGGGGGWYGGYSSQTKADAYYSTYSGAGGSGYILTETSYKPEGYHPSSEYYFRDSFMSQAQSYEGEIIIARRVTSLAAGDVIEFPCVGEVCAITLPGAAYKIRCYGADGGYRYLQKHAARGGYSEGEITLTSPTDIFVHVGGASHPRWNYGGRFWSDTHTNALINVPTLSYNGGGIPPVTSGINWTSGGGGTDVRIGVDDLYHRLIVAGGGGSEGGFNNGEYGGTGGGKTGGVSYGSSGYNNGPGTQTGSPSGTAVSVAGSFGQGGPTMNLYGDYGGSGGGGWYGGSGTQPYSRTDVNKGGAGGSGYVLTETSYKPEGYALGEQYYMTNAFTSTGGNTLPLFQSKVVIEVQRMFKTIICKDTQGYKYFDTDTSQWLLMEPQPTVLTKAAFDQLMPSMITSDEGLEDTYTVYVYDEGHSITSISLEVVPVSQTISYEMELRQMISDIIFDTESYDEEAFNVKVLSHERIDDDTVKINISVDKLENTDQTLKLYSAQLQTRGNYGSHTYINPDGKRDYYTYDKNTNQIIHDRRKFEYRDPEQYRDPVTGLMTTAQWLLPVGKGSRLPVSYRNDVIDYGVTNIYDTCIYEHNRTLYIAMLVRFNNDASQTYLIIKGLNFMTAALTELARIPWSDISTVNALALGDMIVDDTYYWISPIYGTNQRFITRINRMTLELVRTPSTTYTIRAYGRMCMLDTDGQFLVATENGLEAYSPIHNEWEVLTTWTRNVNINDICVGKSIIIITTISSNVIQIIDRLTDLVTNFTLPTPTSVTPTVCYDGKGAFYISATSYIIKFDEESRTVTDQYVASVVSYPAQSVYINNAVFITPINSSRVVMYRPDVRNYVVINLPWSLPGKGTSDGSSSYGLFLPCVTNGYFLLLYRTMCIINYTGTSKYDMGYKYDRTIAYYNASNIEHMEYDDRFVTVTDTFTEVHNGMLTYTFSAYDANHIAHVEITKNDTYRYLRNVSFYSET